MTMESIRLSSSSVRESSEKILAVQRSTSTGVVFTVDRLAVRLWYADKQIKALHFTETDHQLDVVGIEYVSRIDGIAALLHIVKTIDDVTNVNSVFRIWSSTLQVLCQVSYNLVGLSKRSYIVGSLQALTYLGKLLLPVWIGTFSRDEVLLLGL